ncbi:MAG: glutaredoxin domain-containing protein [Anaerolineales bacterium]
MDKIKLFGTTWCGGSKRAQRLFDKEQVDYEWIDIDNDPIGEKFVIENNHGFRSVPTILFPDGTILVEPSNYQLTEKIDSITNKKQD